MKRNLILITSASLFCAVALIAAAQGRRAGTPTLAVAAKQALITALSGEAGEYAARAEYKAILDKFGAEVQPYANIYQAEERHVAALVRQCQKLGVAVPEDPYMEK